MRILQILICLLLFMGCKPKPPLRQPVTLTEDTLFLTGTFYVVRHAASNPGPDTTLSRAGRQQASALYALLKDTALDKIYITNDKRSIATADSLRLHLHIDTCFYELDTSGESLIYELTRRKDWGKRILVIGHANTIIPILHSFKVKPDIDYIGEGEYDRLFIVQKNRDKIMLKESRVGHAKRQRLAC